MNEKQKREAAALRAAIEKAGRGPNGQVAPALKSKAASWVAARVAEDVQQRTLASALGLHESTISSWMRARRAGRLAEATSSAAEIVSADPPAVVEVKLRRRASRARSARPLIEGTSRSRHERRDLVLVDPSGVRVEGLDVATVVAILRGLR